MSFELQQGLEPINFSSLHGEFLNLCAGINQFGVELPVRLSLAPHFVKRGPAMRRACNDVVETALQRAKNIGGPDVDQPDVLVSRDLKREKQELTKKHADQHEEGCVPCYDPRQPGILLELCESRPFHRKPLLFYSNPAKQVEVRQHPSSPEHYGSQRVFGDRDGQPGLFPYALVEVFQQRAASGEDDATI